MTARPPTWMFVLLGLQLVLALAGVAALIGLGNGMSGHSVPFAHDDVPMLFPAIAVVVLGIPALILGARKHRTLSTTLALAPYPVAVVLMLWAWL